MLLVMLGGILLLMRQLEQQATIDYLGRVFAAPTEGDPRGSRDGLPTDMGKQGGVWNAVEDNTMFLPAERPAWDELLKLARDTLVEDLAELSIGQVAYAQLVNQPEVYRGEVVRVQGRVIREVHKRAPSGTSGIGEYFQLAIAPAGGGEWPIIVYALELPKRFPRGSGLSEPVTVDGWFFKNWSYAHEDGLGLAPVIVARTVAWQPPAEPAASARQDLNVRDLLYGAAGAALVAALFAFWVRRQTQRPPSKIDPSPDFSKVEEDP